MSLGTRGQSFDGGAIQNSSVTRIGHDFIERAKRLGPVEVLVGGTPGQGFSFAGNREGFRDARSLRARNPVRRNRPRYPTAVGCPGKRAGLPYDCLRTGLWSLRRESGSVEWGRWRALPTSIVSGLAVSPPFALRCHGPAGTTLAEAVGLGRFPRLTVVVAFHSARIGQFAMIPVRPEHWSPEQRRGCR